MPLCGIAVCGGTEYYRHYTGSRNRARVLDSLRHMIWLDSRHYGEGEMILEQGDTGDEVFLLHDGQVDVVVHSMGVVTTLQQGTVFGEMAALLGTFTRCEVHTATL